MPPPPGRGALYPPPHTTPLCIRDPLSPHHRMCTRSRHGCIPTSRETPHLAGTITPPHRIARAIHAQCMHQPPRPSRTPCQGEVGVLVQVRCARRCILHLGPSPGARLLRQASVILSRRRGIPASDSPPLQASSSRASARSSDTSPKNSHPVQAPSTVVRYAANRNGRPTWWRRFPTCERSPWRTGAAIISGGSPLPCVGVHGRAPLPPAACTSR